MDVQTEAFVKDLQTAIPSERASIRAVRLHFFWSQPSIRFRSEFDFLVRVPPVFFGKTELKERMKLSAFFSEWVAW
jgi:hypothetical protein